MPKKPTERNTKAEILSAYQELLKEKKELENQLSQPSTPKQQPLVKPTPVVELPTAQTSPMSHSSDSIKKILQELQTIQLGFGGALNQLSDRLVNEATQLEIIESEVSEQRQQLEDLYALDISDGSLDELLESYEVEAKTFAQEWEERKETVEQELGDRQRAWEKEQQNHERDIKERNEQTGKQLVRDRKTYDYDVQLRWKLSDEAYQQTQEHLEQELVELQETHDKRWKEREEAIAEREKAYAEAKEKVEAFAQELEDNTKRGKDNGRNIGHYQVKIKADLRHQEIEGQKKVYDLRLQGLSETIQNQETRIQNLSKQLDSALQQVQDLAVKAIEGAANAKTSEALKDVAIEQAKQLKGK